MITSALIRKLRTIHPRVYENITPKHTLLPAVTVDLAGSFRNRHFGTTNKQTGLIETDFEISSWGDTAASVYSLAESIIAGIENFAGPWLAGDNVTHRIANVEITGETSDFDGTTELHTYSIFITITHTLAS